MAEQHKVLKFKLTDGTVVEAFDGSGMHSMYLQLGARELDARGHRKPVEDNPLSVVDPEPPAEVGANALAAETVDPAHVMDTDRD